MFEAGNLRYIEPPRTPGQAYAELLDQPLLTIRGTYFPAGAAVYLLYFDGAPVFAGRTDNLREQLQGSVARQTYSASFAYRRALEATGMSGATNDELADSDEFVAAFESALDLLRDMQVRYLVVEDPVEERLLELHARLQIRSDLAEFRAS